MCIRDRSTPYFGDFAQELRKGRPVIKKERKNLLQKIAALFSGEKEVKPDFSKPVVVTVVKNFTTGKRDTVSYNLTTTKENGLIGIFPIPLETALQEYSFAEAMPAGFDKGYNFLADQIKAFGQIFKGKIKASESLGGFGSIAGMFDTSWNWHRFWTMTAILSLILGFMNLLPIPALDGGHVMFLLYEVVSGRKPSDKFMEYSTIVGFVIVMGLVLYANGMDLFRWISG